MTTWYFDATNGVDANAGTSISAPKKMWENFSQPSAAAGDTFLFLRGTTQVFVNGFTQLKGGTSETAICRYGVYGSGTSPVTWTKPSGAGNMLLNLSNALKYIDVEDMVFDAGTVCLNVIYCAIQGASNAGFLRFYRCHFKNATSSGYNTGTESLKTGIMSNLVFEDCEFYDNGGHGIILSGVNTCFLRRCKFYRNGATLSTGGHGFSSGASKTSATSGWTNTSGTIWQRTLAANETTIYYVMSSVTSFTRLRLTAGTQTAPGLGEYGVSGGILYINVNSASNPSGQSIIYAWKRAYALTVEDCEAYDNIWNQSAPYHEGHGFAFDDWADDSVFRRNKSYNNQGAGFSINRGDRNTLVGNIAYGNWQSALVIQPNDNLQVINNTFYSNNTGLGATAGEIFSNGSSKTAVISNNILLATVNYGISSETSDTGFTGSKNCVNGHIVAAEKNPFMTGTVSVNPNLDANYRPQAATVIRAGSYLGGKDFYGKQFYNSPNIGAVDDLTTTPRYVLISA